MIGKTPPHPARSVRAGARGRPFAAFVLALAAAALAAGCASRLLDAKRAFAEGQERARLFQEEGAVAAFKRALLDAEAEAQRNPSAQAFMIKGMAESSLGRWREAEASFLRAFALGFDQGQAWASDAALIGLAGALRETGMADASTRICDRLVETSDYRPVLVEAARRSAEAALARAVEAAPEERARILKVLSARVDKLMGRDFACGFFHYLAAQVAGHAGDGMRAYEEAVLARGLGLPTLQAARDNDLQIVYAFETARAGLAGAEAAAFESGHAARATSWGWPDARTPEWKRKWP